MCDYHCPGCEDCDQVRTCERMQPDGGHNGTCDQCSLCAENGDFEPESD